jgi:spore coat polysaccharide biosynthesis protein SpsF
VGYHRGSEEDVLSRFYEAAVNFNADVIVRVTSDCPLIDPQLIENVIDCYSQSTSEYARLDLGCFPRGLDVEVLSFDALERSHLQAANHEHREHVTLFVYQNEAIFGKVSYSIEEDYSKYRFTLDTIEDWQLISSIFEHLYRPEYAICYKDIIHLLEQYPELAEINANIEQKHQTR